METDRAFAGAFVFGTVPLIVGGALYLGYRWTEWPGFALAGLVFLLIGLALFGAGCYCLVRFGSLSGWSRARTRIDVSLLALLLLSNFPAAWACMKSGLSVYSPRVEPDWVKARCQEFASHGPDRVPWTRVGSDRWYFHDQRFGARLFRYPDEKWALILTPDGDGPNAYVLLSDRSIRYSGDPASNSYTWYWMYRAEEGPRWEWYSAWREFP